MFYYACSYAPYCLFCDMVWIIIIIMIIRVVIITIIIFSMIVVVVVVVVIVIITIVIIILWTSVAILAQAHSAVPWPVRHMSVGASTCPRPRLLRIATAADTPRSDRLHHTGWSEPRLAIGYASQPWPARVEALSGSPRRISDRCCC